MIYYTLRACQEQHFVSLEWTPIVERKCWLYTNSNGIIQVSRVNPETKTLEAFLQIVPLDIKFGSMSTRITGVSIDKPDIVQLFCFVPNSVSPE